MPNFYDEKKEEEGDIFDELMTLGLLCEHACRPRSAESECKSNSREMKIFIIFSWDSSDRCILNVSFVERCVNNRAVNEHNTSRFFSLPLFFLLFLLSTQAVISMRRKERLRDQVIGYTYFFPHLPSFLMFSRKIWYALRVYIIDTITLSTWFIRFATSFSNNNDNIIIVVVVVLMIIIII